jgi:hypothetical protein
LQRRLLLLQRAGAECAVSQLRAHGLGVVSALDVPAVVLVFAGDLPRRDDPLPRFLDDGAAAKLLQATRAIPTRSPASRWSSWSAPGCARASSAI